ncbi:MAG: HepT-like ribonuclease domain-containing protein [Janthinobacterium lividum]
MDNNIKTWLHDILNAIVEIDSFFDNGPKVFAYYQKDLRTKRAVERNIEIIDEAMNRILKLDESIPITSSRKLVDVRNRIIHEYDSVSDDVIWGIVVKHLPVLNKEVTHLLNEH